jgi:hypothetical protein
MAGSPRRSSHERKREVRFRSGGADGDWAAPKTELTRFSVEER